MIEVKEFAVIENIEVTGSYRIVHLELAEHEEVVLETPPEEKADDDEG